MEAVEVLGWGREGEHVIGKSGLGLGHTKEGRGRRKSRWFLVSFVVRHFSQRSQYGCHSHRISPPKLTPTPFSEDHKPPRAMNTFYASSTGPTDDGTYTGSRQTSSK